MGRFLATLPGAERSSEGGRPKPSLGTLSDCDSLLKPASLLKLIKLLAVSMLISLSAFVDDEGGSFESSSASSMLFATRLALLLATFFILLKDELGSDSENMRWTWSSSGLGDSEGDDGPDDIDDEEDEEVSDGDEDVGVDEGDEDVPVSTDTDEFEVSDEETDVFRLSLRCSLFFLMRCLMWL